MGVWPHTPSPELFQQAVQAHHAVYHRNQPEHPIPVRDFQLAEIMDDVKHAGSFRIRALREFKDLRLINPRTPGRAHIIAVALTGSSPLTIGAGTASRHSEHPCHTDQSNQAQQPDSLFTNQDVAISFSQLVRDPGWTGLDPILPLFRNKHALIIGDPTSGRPRAAVGLLPETINAEDLAR